MALNTIYNVLKTEYWPYRYYFMIIIIFFLTFSWDMVTISRVIRFLIICVVLIIYKKWHNYLKSKSYSNLKNLKYWMWVHVIINPVLYVVWKWDLYIYYKINYIMNECIKSDNIKKFLIIIICNLSVPIKIIYIRFYITLNLIKQSTFYEFMFNRIYGFIISILIFSNIWKYLLWLTGGYLNLLLNIYIILYIINVIYTVYYHYHKNFKYLKKSISVNTPQWVKNMLIYKIIVDYIRILKDIEINEVIKYRGDVTILGVYIIKHINHTNIYKININEIPEIWCGWISNNRFRYVDFEEYKYGFIFLSYEAYEFISKISGLKIKQMLKPIFLNNNYKYFDIYEDIYTNAIDCLSELFEAFESVLVYKYYVYKKGALDLNFNRYITSYIELEEWEYIYKMYLLVIKNVIYYIWSFEYYILQDKSKLTKLHVIDTAEVDFGYHIYSKDKENFNQYDNFPWLISGKDFTNDKVIPWNSNSYVINEGVHLLSSFQTTIIPLVYIKAKNNQELKEVILLLNKYENTRKIHVTWNNPWMHVKKEILKEYFQDLDNIIQVLYKEWELNYMDKKYLFKNQEEVLLELINHYKSKCHLH